MQRLVPKIKKYYISTFFVNMCLPGRVESDFGMYRAFIDYEIILHFN